MSKTVDLVVAGGGTAAISAAIEAARKGSQVLLVTGPTDRTSVRRIRRLIRSGALRIQQRITVMPGTELVCVDGVGGTEAVVVRHVGSGRLTAFNTRGVERFLS